MNNKKNNAVLNKYVFIALDVAFDAYLLVDWK